MQPLQLLELVLQGLQFLRRQILLNFVGTGNTFALRGTTIDVSISGGGAGAGGTWSNYDSNAGVTTTKKVKIQNNLEVTGVTTSTGGFVGNVTGNAKWFSGSCSGNSATVLASEIWLLLMDRRY